MRQTFTLALIAAIANGVSLSSLDINFNTVQGDVYIAVEGDTGVNQEVQPSPEPEMPEAVDGTDVPEQDSDTIQDDSGDNNTENTLETDQTDGVDVIDEQDTSEEIEDSSLEEACQEINIPYQDGMKTYTGLKACDTLIFEISPDCPGNRFTSSFPMGNIYSMIEVENNTLKIENWDVVHLGNSSSTSYLSWY